MTLARPELAVLSHAARAGEVLQVAERLSERVLELTRSIAEIPAPTFDESDRATAVRAAFTAAGLQDIQRDELHNVVARLPGRTRKRPLLLAAHLDTVFSRATPVAVRESDGRLHGPGIGDNSLGIASLLVLPELLREIGAIPGVDVLMTGNVGEEGQGNLVGIRKVMDDHPELGALIAIEGHNLGRVTHVAVGSVRLRATVTGPGGHSWGDFGNPNAIHAAAEMIAGLGRLALPQTPKTTLSVGVIRGGTSVNTIAPSTTFDLDMRSTDAAALARLVDRARSVLRPSDDRISVDIHVLGERPAGYLSVGSRIVRTGIEVLRLLGYSASADASSTDANLAIHRELPSICIGLTFGGNVHAVDEYIETAPVAAGVAQLALLTMAVTEELARGTLD